MELSARNKLSGTIKSIKSGAVMAEITVNVEAGLVTAAITDSSAGADGARRGRRGRRCFQVNRSNDR